MKPQARTSDDHNLSNHVIRPDQYSPVCPRCKSTLARNLSKEKPKPQAVKRVVNGVTYRTIEHKKVQCGRKACQQTFIVSRLGKPDPVHVEKPAPTSSMGRIFKGTFF